MATSKEFIAFVTDALARYYPCRVKKAFGEYIVYVEEKPVLTVCDDTVFVKKREELSDLLSETGSPYPGAKEHYVLDAGDGELLRETVRRLLAAAG